MGGLIGEIFDLEASADHCATDGVYEFLFAAPPLPITGAVGSPINPLALNNVRLSPELNCAVYPAQEDR